ncbi:ACL088Cp [Eremothecium gossypii ATCC 10895]|uniref:ACL088Cp n=1 Tax=Eremothecium gossypii (strain ATCC 10895 / CBS 109.51 / FGSC 9923 / NRRL Y-1056) TaxID=284811 RepID=Q75CK7_EREGS|nr:ACL088Cp [Eremothecium gossypii ATCC 10895]AAS51140.1 ACL088Cp [Eremothecium gossypii ATCC 10895]AEY95430.1 FACL088Cp [Eremothecium gossypii FDAG1]
MYRSRNKSKAGDNEVRGPNSALTQFLREQGISAESIKERWKSTRQSESQDSADAAETDSDKGDSDYDGSSSDGAPESGLESSRASSRARSNPVDSDEEEYEEGVAARQGIRPKREPEMVQEVLKRRKQALQRRQAKRKRAMELLDRKTKRIPTLQDVCVAVIGESIMKHKEHSLSVNKHILDVLGGVSVHNMNKLADALSKSRALNDRTLQLFLNVNLETITFHDCSNISADGYKSLAAFTPHLRAVSLQMCGQLNNEALLLMAEKLTNLRELYLDGPFLINDETWGIFFERMGDKLEAFHVSNTHRFTDDSLQKLLLHCGGSLRSLKLSRLDSISNYALLPRYLHQDVHTLILQYPSNEEDITDEIMINLLGVVGNSLKVLNLDGCTGITDSFLVNGLASNVRSGSDSCSLERLSLEELDQVTSDGFITFFSSVQLPRLHYLNLRRCHQLDDASIAEIWLNPCSKFLKELNLNSARNLTAAGFQLMSCPNLQQLNVGFVRCVDDKLLAHISECAPNLEIVEVYGDNLVTQNASARGVTIIGRQSDSI